LLKPPKYSCRYFGWNEIVSSINKTRTMKAVSQQPEEEEQRRVGSMNPRSEEDEGDDDAPGSKKRRLEESPMPPRQQQVSYAVSPLSIPAGIIKKLSTLPGCVVEKADRVQYYSIVLDADSGGQKVLQDWANSRPESGDDPAVSIVWGGGGARGAPVPTAAVANEIMSIYHHYSPLMGSQVNGFVLPAPLAAAPAVVHVHLAKVALMAATTQVRAAPPALYPALAAASAAGAGAPVCHVSLAYRNAQVILPV
jgi:hypothetical protein